MAKVKKYRPKIAKTKSYLFKFFTYPLIFAVFAALLKTNYQLFFIALIAFVLFAIGARLLESGLKNERIYHEKSVAARPRPLKLLSSMFLGVGTTFLALFAGGDSLLIASFLGLSSMIGFYLYYGFDPMVAKSIEAQYGITTAKVIESIDIANEKITTLTTHNEHIKDKRLHLKVNTAAQKAQTIVNQLERNPASIWKARKFLYVYLDGIVDVINDYMKIEDKTKIEEGMKINLYMLFDKADNTFNKELEQLESEKLVDLSINMEVLRQRLGESHE